jgi:hypothetical protein
LTLSWPWLIVVGSGRRLGLFARDLSTDGFRNSQNAWSSDGAERDTLSLAGQSLFFSSSSGIPALSRQFHRAKNNE